MMKVSFEIKKGQPTHPMSPHTSLKRWFYLEWFSMYLQLIFLWSTPRNLPIADYYEQRQAPYESNREYLDRWYLCKHLERLRDRILDRMMWFLKCYLSNMQPIKVSVSPAAWSCLLRKWPISAKIKLVEIDQNCKSCNKLNSISPAAWIVACLPWR